jgi:hypothetical protein
MHTSDLAPCSISPMGSACHDSDSNANQPEDSSNKSEDEIDYIAVVQWWIDEGHLVQVVWFIVRAVLN